MRSFVLLWPSQNSQRERFGPGAWTAEFLNPRRGSDGGVQLHAAAFQRSARPQPARCPAGGEHPPARARPACKELLGANTSAGRRALLAISQAPDGDHRAEKFLGKEPAGVRSSPPKILLVGEWALQGAEPRGTEGKSFASRTSPANTTARARSQAPRMQK